MLEIIAIEMVEPNNKYYWGKNKKYKKEWNELVKNSPRHNAVEYFKKYGKPQKYHLILMGMPETIEEKLVEAFYDDGKVSYINLSDRMPEDFIESRMDFYELKDYADDMKYFIKDLLNMIRD